MQDHAININYHKFLDKIKNGWIYFQTKRNYSKEEYIKIVEEYVRISGDVDLKQALETFKKL